MNPMKSAEYIILFLKDQKNQSLWQILFENRRVNISMVHMPKKKPRKRIKIKGHYMQVRQRSTKKGKKGTIIGKWKPKKKR